MPLVVQHTPIERWDKHVNKWRNCRECPLCDQRYRIVLGRGSVPAQVVFLGEAPGDSENVVGQPFKGPAGGLLDQIVERSVGAFNSVSPIKLSVAYTNLVACYPREAKEEGTHRPKDNEIEACQNRLREFLEICRPRLIVAVGALAEDNLPLVLNSMVYSGGMVEGHATVEKVVSIVHPSYILSRLPIAQQGMAVQKAIVTVSTALEEIDWS